VAEAEQGLYLRRYPNRRHKKLGPVSFLPSGYLVSEKQCCTCSKLVQLTELTPCVRHPLKNITFSVTCLLYEIRPDIVFELVVISMYFIAIQKYTENMAIFCDYAQTEEHLLAPYYQYMLQ